MRTRIRRPKHTCSVCSASTGYAIVGNQILSQWDVDSLPTEEVPEVVWRCDAHLRYKQCAAMAVKANAQGDLLFTLVCGHVVQMMFRRVGGYTPEMVTRALEEGAIRLEKRHRCYFCGDSASMPSLVSEVQG